MACRRRAFGLREMPGAPAHAAEPDGASLPAETSSRYLECLGVVREIVTLGPKVQHIVFGGWGGNGLQPLCRQARRGGRQAAPARISSCDQPGAAPYALSHIGKSLPGAWLRTAVADAAPVEAAAWRQRAREWR